MQVRFIVVYIDKNFGMGLNNNLISSFNRLKVIYTFIVNQDTYTESFFLKS